MTAPSAAVSSPAALRNREPILQVLRELLPRPAKVLEIASGSGEHAVYFASALPHVIWHPTDRDGQALVSIAAYRAAAQLPNLNPPLPLDVHSDQWPLTDADVIVAINMVHIAPWSATEALMAGAKRSLSPTGLLYLYGPYKRNGAHTAPSNAEFDAQLRARNPEWGVRDLDDVEAVALRHGLRCDRCIAMPANNLSLVFRPLGKAPV